MSAYSIQGRHKLYPKLPVTKIVPVSGYGLAINISSMKYTLSDKLIAYLALISGLTISAVAIWYSVAGLVSIFSAATIAIIVMGVALEVSKLIATVWLKLNWNRAPVFIRTYLLIAIAVLMLITSMGIFGFLSKAHSDQSLVSGDVQSKIAIYDEKIKTAKDNIDANRKALKQMDEAVDQVMGRSSDEKGADKAVAIRRAQQKERVRLQSEIASEQKTIAALNEEAAPLRAEFRKIEAEVGPIKYIAALVYGDNPDANVLEKAVRLVIIMIVLVFDPLALTLILAANKQFEWARQGKGGFVHDEDDNPNPEPAKEPPTPEPELSIFDQHPYLLTPFSHFKDLKPMVANPPLDSGSLPIPDVERPVDYATLPEHEDDEEDPAVKAAVKQWKFLNPNDTLKNQRHKLQRGEIAELPWMKLVADNDPGKETKSGFGTEFPTDPGRGDTFVKVDQFPNVVYKYNGTNWMEVDKNLTDSYTYDTAYIDHLIDRIARGEYDPDLLSETEREQVAERLQQTNSNT